MHWLVQQLLGQEPIRLLLSTVLRCPEIEKPKIYLSAQVWWRD
jgi:hypothetical protein